MRPTILVVCMHGAGHIQVLLPLIEGLRRRDCVVHAWTHAEFRDRVEGAGARFADLYERHPLEAADAKSLPIPSRFVSFAGVYGERLTREAGRLAPDLIVYDTFTVLAPVIAQGLGIPYVNVFANHAPVPELAVAALREDPRASTSAECWAAIDRLQNIHGMSSANPFSYMECTSPHLNLYGEPEEFLDGAERAAFEPIAFFGSLANTPAPGQGEAIFPRASKRLRLYVSFGTVVWWYFRKEARDALQAVSDGLAGREIDVVISLGGHRLGKAARAAIGAPNVRVLDTTDQWSVLAQADAFVTHHGINSTHESIFQRVPMLSHPFFGDQPTLAARCQELGLALPLIEGAGGTLERDAVPSALERLAEDREGFAARIEEARSWELRTIAGREAVLDRVLALIRAR